ncbi:hypothetical protein, partial [Sutterella wadsworthensis]|uniref:hypothetical protein n=1 Tax=Sutterella wadsworthensis TaxID=40545 RepID=UPI003FF02F79
ARPVVWEGARCKPAPYPILTGAPFEAAASRRFLALKKQSINAQVYFVFHRAAKNALSSAAKFKYDDILKIFSADL